MPEDDLSELYDRPGFMLRRAHQISTSVFLQANAELRITPTQFGILVLLSRRSNLDQITVARLLGLDRSTTGMVLRSLELAGLIARVTDPADKRRRTMRLTLAGQRTLQRAQGPAAQAVERLLAPLSPAERPVFLRLLGKLTTTLNATARVPLLNQAPTDGAHAPAAASPARGRASRS